MLGCTAARTCLEGSGRGAVASNSCVRQETRSRHNTTSHAKTALTTHLEVTIGIRCHVREELFRLGHCGQSVCVDMSQYLLEHLIGHQARPCCRVPLTNIAATSHTKV